MITPITQQNGHTEPVSRGWLLERLSGYLLRDPVSIDPTLPLAEYGMDSVAALSLCGDLEDEFGLVVEPTLLWDYPTVDALAAHLAQALPLFPEERPR
jgi:acyl carrier protein